MKKSTGAGSTCMGLRRLSSELGLIKDKGSDSEVSAAPSDELVITDMKGASGGSDR